MKYYFIKSIDLPFAREWSIYNNWISNDRESLIEKVRKDLETEVLLEPTIIVEDNDWLLVNDSQVRWLKICELELV